MGSQSLQPLKQVYYRANRRQHLNEESGTPSGRMSGIKNRIKWGDGVRRGEISLWGAELMIKTPKLIEG